MAFYKILSSLWAIPRLHKLIKSLYSISKSFKLFGKLKFSSSPSALARLPIRSCWRFFKIPSDCFFQSIRFKAILRLSVFYKYILILSLSACSSPLSIPTNLSIIYPMSEFLLLSKNFLIFANFLSSRLFWIYLFSKFNFSIVYLRFAILAYSFTAFLLFMLFRPLPWSYSSYKFKLANKP